jgi:hypothetical protein
LRFARPRSFKCAAELRRAGDLRLFRLKHSLCFRIGSESENEPSNKTNFNEPKPVLHHVFGSRVYCLDRTGQSVRALMRNFSIIFFTIFLAGCSTLKKVTDFHINRDDRSSKEALCKNPRFGADVAALNGYEFYFASPYAPYWTGPILLPVIPSPLSGELSELQLNFNSKAPLNYKDWKIRFASDGLTVPGTLDKDGRTAVILFSFPPRNPSDKFDLEVTDLGKTSVIKYQGQTSGWQYSPFFLPLGDSFPHLFECKR